MGYSQTLLTIVFCFVAISLEPVSFCMCVLFQICKKNRNKSCNRYYSDDEKGWSKPTFKVFWRNIPMKLSKKLLVNVFCSIELNFFFDMKYCIKLVFVYLVRFLSDFPTVKVRFFSEFLRLKPYVYFIMYNILPIFKVRSIPLPFEEKISIDFISPFFWAQI